MHKISLIDAHANALFSKTHPQCMIKLMQKQVAKTIQLCIFATQFLAVKASGTQPPLEETQS